MNEDQARLLVIRYGKYSGRTLGWIMDNDGEYIRWLGGLAVDSEDPVGKGLYLLKQTLETRNHGSAQ